MEKEIIFNSAHRIKHFNYFNGMNHPYFNLTAMLDVSIFYREIKDRGLPFTPALVYLISRTANEIKEFRWRVRKDKVIEHDAVHPSFSVMTDHSDVFSFCHVNYTRVADEFIRRSETAIELMKTQPVMEDDEHRDDYLFMSAIPWVHFTSMQHAMQSHPGDSVPRFVWGKYEASGNKLNLPFSIQAHHAVVDGRHMGRFFKLLQEYLSTDEWMSVK